MWHDIEQNTDEWLLLRAGKVTGSSIAKIMANYGKAFGDPAKDLAVNIAVERVTGNVVSNGDYSNSHMERGHIEEPIARQRYEDRTFCEVMNGGFYDNDNTGSSPDGRVGDNGLIEIKSAIPSVHYKRIKSESFDYKWQRIFNLRESGREWIDAISYCALFPEETRLYIVRTYHDQVTDDLLKIKLRLEEFEELVNSITATIK